MLKIGGSRESIFSIAAPDETEAVLLVKPSRAVFAHLLSNTSVKDIYCAPGIYATIPAKVLAALSGSGVRVHKTESTRGRPRKVGEEFELARGLAQKIGARNAIHQARIAKSTYYYRLKREKAREEVSGAAAAAGKV